MVGVPRPLRLENQPVNHVTANPIKQLDPKPIPSTSPGNRASDAPNYGLIVHQAHVVQIE